MKICVDPVIKLLNPTGGISRVFFQHMASLESAPSVEMRFLKYRIRHRLLVKFLLFLPRRVGRNEIFITSYYTYTLFRRSILLVHDLIFVKKGASFKGSLFKFLFLNALKRASLIICVSKTTEIELRQHFSSKVKCKIVTVPNSVDRTIFRIHCLSNNSTIRSGHFIFVGPADVDYKNFGIIYQILSIRSDLKCLHVGRRGSCEDYSKFEISGNIQNISWCSDRSLVALYNQSRFLFYPSLTEGFGIPIVEALSCGIPVLLFDAIYSTNFESDYIFKFRDLRSCLDRVEMLTKSEFDPAEVRKSIGTNFCAKKNSDDFLRIVRNELG